MSNTHRGQIQNQIIQEEHEGDLNAKRTSMVSAATIYAVVNTAAAAQASIVLDDSINSIGFATVHQGDDPWTVVNIGNVTVEQGDDPWVTSNTGNITVEQGDDPWNVAVVGNVTLSDSKKYIGLTSVSGTVEVGAGVAGIGFATIDVASIAAGVNSIGFATVHQGDDPWTVDGTVTLGAGLAKVGFATVDVQSNTAWSDPSTWIGLVSVANPLPVDATGQGDVPITLDSEAVVLGAGVAEVGFATVEVGSIAAGVNSIGFATVEVGSIAAGSNYVGLASVNVGGTLPALSAGVAGIGFATVKNPDSEYTPTYTANPTVNWILKGSAGFLHAVHVGAAVGSGVVEISDHATDGDGNIKFFLSGDTLGPAVYPVNMKMSTGITADITTQTNVTVIWR